MRPNVSSEQIGETPQAFARPDVSSAARPRQSKQRIAVLASVCALLAACALGWLLMGTAWAQQSDEQQIYCDLRVLSYDPSFSFDGRARETATDLERFRDTQSKLVRSPLILKTALETPAVAALNVIASQKDPLAWLQTAIRARFIDHEVMRVFLTGVSGKEGQVLLDAVVDAYLDEVSRGELRRLETRLMEFRKLEARRKAAVRTESEGLRLFAEKAGLGPAGSDRLVLLNQDLLAQLRARLLDTEIQTEVREGELAALTDPESPPVMSDEERKRLTAAIKRLKRERVLRERQIKDLETASVTQRDTRMRAMLEYKSRERALDAQYNIVAVFTEAIHKLQIEIDAWQPRIYRLENPFD